MSEETPRVICIGEVLIELTRGPDGAFTAACAGDSFNTAVYLARAGLNVGFATAVGEDPYSDSIVALALAEGLGANLILRAPGRLPALGFFDDALMTRAVPGDGRLVLRGRACGAEPVRSALASIKATASSSVTVSGVLSAGNVALTPLWLT